MPFDEYTLKNWVKKRSPFRVPRLAGQPPQPQPPPKYDLSDANVQGLQPFDPGAIQYGQPKPPPAPPPERRFSAPTEANAAGAPFRGVGADSGAVGAGDYAQTQSALTQKTKQFSAPKPGSSSVEKQFSAPTESGPQVGHAPGRPGAAANPTTGETSAEKAKLDALLAEYEQGKPIEDWKTGEKQAAAQTLANAEDAALAQAGGTETPYATLAGIAGQGEYLKRLGDINAKDVEWWTKRMQSRENLLTQMEEWNRQNKPDLFAQWQPKIAATFGRGAIIRGDYVLMPDNTKLKLDQMSGGQRETFAAYQAAMGVPPLEETQNPEEQQADQNAFDRNLAAMDPDMANSTTAEMAGGGDADPAETAIFTDAYREYKRTGQVPTNRWFRDQYDAHDQEYGNAKWADWPEGDERWNDPAW